MKAFAARYPFLFAVAATAAGVLAQLWPFWVPGLSTTVLILLARTSAVVVAVGLLTSLGWWAEAGFARPAGWRVVLPYLPLACIGLLLPLLGALLTGIKVTAPGAVALGLLSYLLGAFVEEAIFRGVALRALLPGGLMRANLLAATIFATAHLPGLLVGADLVASVVQWVYTWCFGFAAVAALAYARNIWPLVVIHAGTNFLGFLVSGSHINTARPSAADALVQVVVLALPAIFGYWLLRRAERQPLRPSTPKPEASG